MSTIVGIHQQYQNSADQTTVAKTLAMYPLTQATREFNANPIDPQNLIPKVESACREVWDAGLIAAWSVKLKPGFVKDGKWKPYIQQLASHIKSQGLEDQFILIIWHEPENDAPKWFKNGADFVKYFNTVHDWVKGVAPGILTSHAALGYRYGDVNKGTSAKPKMVPIDLDDAAAKTWKTKADIHTLDLYQGRSWPLKQIAPENSAFKRWHKCVVGGPGKPWGFSERGFIADAKDDEALADRVTTIRREADWLAEDPVGRDCVLALLWDTIGTEGDQNIPIRDEAGKDAVRYYMTRASEVAPELPDEPVPPVDPGQMTDCPLCHGTGLVKQGQTITIVKAS